MNKRCVIVYALMTLLLASDPAGSAAQPGTDCLIKGIIGSTGQKMYVLPGHYLYAKVTPDLNKGEQWFCEAAGAERAGFVFVPDPTNPNLRSQTVTPTPPPAATPEPAEVAEESSADVPATTESAQPVESAAAPEPEPTEPPTLPTATPAPIETIAPEPVSDGPAADPFPEATPPLSQPDLTGTPLEQLGPLIHLFPPEALVILQQLPPEALALIASASTWIPVIFGISLFIGIMVIVVRWKLFVKAGEPGWAAIIPIYSEILMLKIAGLAWWWVLIGIIPVVQLAFVIVWVFIRPFKTAGNFGKGFLYGLGLFLFPLAPLVWLHLAFSGAEYSGS